MSYINLHTTQRIREESFEEIDVKESDTTAPPDTDDETPTQGVEDVGEDVSKDEGGYTLNIDERAGTRIHMRTHADSAQVPQHVQYSKRLQHSQGPRDTTSREVSSRTIPRNAGVTWRKALGQTDQQDIPSYRTTKERMVSDRSLSPRTTPEKTVREHTLSQRTTSTHAPSVQMPSSQTSLQRTVPKRTMLQQPIQKNDRPSHISIPEIDSKLIHFFRNISDPMARFGLFVVFFWFGALKVIDMSPASPLVQALFERTIPFIPFSIFLIVFGAFEMVIGLMFLIKGFEREVLPLLTVHMITTAMPLILLGAVTWTAPFVPTMEGQYIIKNLVIVATAIAVAAHIHPMPHKRPQIVRSM